MGEYIENYYEFLGANWEVGFIFWAVLVGVAAVVYITSKLRAAGRKARLAKAHANLKANRAARHNY